MGQEIFPISYLEIYEKALVHNAAAVMEYIRCPVIAVVKRDGYGVSVAKAAKVWRWVGAFMFAVAEPHEALELRRHGIKEDILLLAPVADGQSFEAMVEAGVILSITSFENMLFYESLRGERTIRAHVAVDTGMGRFGLRWSDGEGLKRIYAQRGFSLEGIYSHFSSSFEKKYKRTKVQLERFLSAVELLTRAGFDPGIRHIANSCAALRFPETRLDAARIGSALIGELCCPVPVPLKKAGRLKAQVVDNKFLSAGDTSGYASTYRCGRDTEAIVVALGYENGFGLSRAPESFRLWDVGSGCYSIIKNYKRPPSVLCQGRKLPLIGRVGSQYSLFDATGLSVKPGNYVSADTNMLFTSVERRFV